MSTQRRQRTRTTRASSHRGRIDRDVERLAAAIAVRPGGREALEQLARHDDEDVPLCCLRPPRLAGHLDFFDPRSFPSRAAVRAFVCGEVFGAFAELARVALVGREAFGDLAERIDDSALRDAREALFYILGDLRTLAEVAAGSDAEPVVFGARFQAYSGTSKVRRLAALAQLAAHEAHEGADPDSWMPVLEALRSASAELDAAESAGVGPTS